MTTDKSINRRAWIVFLMLCSGVILPLSGIVLHHSESHHFNSIKWISMAIHNAAAIIFSVSSIFHLVKVRKTIAGYIRNKMSNIAIYPRELLFASSIVVALISLTLIHVAFSHL